MPGTSRVSEVATHERGPKGQVGMFVFGLVVLWSLISIGVSKGLEMKFQTLWADGSGKPVSVHFAYLGFPTSASARLYDAAAGSEIGTLDSAVRLSVEGEASDWITLAGVPSKYVRRSDLTLEPPKNREQWLQMYRQEMSARVGLDFMGADVAIEERGSGPAKVIFKQSWDDSVEKSTYTIEGGRGRPLAYARASAGTAMADTSCWLVPVWVVCGMTGTRFLWRQLKASRALPAP